MAKAAGLLVLPLAVTAVTPFRYREVVGLSSEALLTAFVANSAFIVLPIDLPSCGSRFGPNSTRTISGAMIMMPVPVGTAATELVPAAADAPPATTSI